MRCSTDKISLSINHQDTVKKNNKIKIKKAKNCFLIMLSLMDKKYRMISIVGELGGKDKNFHAGTCMRFLQVNQTLRAGF